MGNSHIEVFNKAASMINENSDVILSVKNLHATVLHQHLGPLPLDLPSD